MNTFLNFMKRNYKVIALVLVASLTLWSFIPKQKGDPEKDKLLLELLLPKNLKLIISISSFE